MVATALVAAASGVVSAPLAALIGLPNAAAWPYILGSVAIHIVYYLALAQAYRSGDLSQVYPIARGSAPLLWAMGTTLWLGEGLGSSALAGVILLALGILLLAARGGRRLARFDARSVGFALATALTITAYTLGRRQRCASLGLCAAILGVAVPARWCRHGAIRFGAHGLRTGPRRGRQLAAGNCRRGPVDRMASPFGP